MYTAEECYPFALLVLCCWREARGESDDAKLGVAWTIKNRVALHGWMGKSYSEVVLKPWQFSSFNASDTNAVKWPVQNDPSYMACVTAAKCAYSDIKADPTDGATHYHDTSISPPKWTVGATKTVQIGKLIFYKDVK